MKIIDRAPEPDGLQPRGHALLRVAEQLVSITTIVQAEAAAALLHDVKAYVKAVMDLTTPVIAAASRALDVVRQQRRALLAPAEVAEVRLKRGLLAWDARERERVAAERREAERQAIEQQAADALDAADAGEPEAAAAILLAPSAPVAPRVEAAIQGVLYQTRWHAEVHDFPALVRAVAEGTAQPGFLQPNQPALDALARSLHEGLRIAGVRAVAERVAVSR